MNDLVCLADILGSIIEEKNELCWTSAYQEKTDIEIRKSLIEKMRGFLNNSSLKNSHA